MKRNLLYLLPLLMMLGAACSTKNDYTPAPPPLGTFSGKFKLLVKKTTGTGFDTVKKDSLFSVKIYEPSNYVVTRSTPTIHALSRGSFKYDPNYSLIAFNDSTYIAGPQSTIHLVGTYQYGMANNGQRLQLQRANQAQDSILFYDLYKTSN